MSKINEENIEISAALIDVLTTLNTEFCRTSLQLLCNTNCTKFMPLNNFLRPRCSYF